MQRMYMMGPGQGQNRSGCPSFDKALLETKWREQQTDMHCNDIKAYNMYKCNTLDCKNNVGYQFSWFSWRVDPQIPVQN